MALWAQVTGVGIAILNDDKVVYLKTYGLRDKEKHLSFARIASAMPANRELANADSQFPNVLH
jgi:hypothetical protein